MSIGVPNMWTQTDTKLWIHEQYLKLEDINHYLQSTVEWLEERGIDDKKTTFICSFMTIIWVNHMRGSLTSKREILEILEVPEWDTAIDQQYVLPPVYVQMELDHEELLQLVIKNKIEI